ncbi:MAG: hypothetical protein LLG20_10615 [Acidobacteriales bacterium]|nr:hypothetical protein [Terriglobales bacterium]
MRQASLILALVVLLAAALPATSATLTWYNDRAAWEAAVGNTFSLIDFSEAPIGSYSTGAGVTIGDVWFQAYNEFGNSYLYVSNNDPTNPNLYATGNALSYPPKAYTSVTFLNGASYLAVGVDVSTSSNSFYVKEDVVGSWVPTNTSGFVGFVSDVPVTQVWFASRTGVNGSQGYYTLDNFVFSNGPAPQPEETPDLDTLILCGTGLSMLSFALRMRKRIQA